MFQQAHWRIKKSGNRFSKSLTFMDKKSEMRKIYLVTTNASKNVAIVIEIKSSHIECLTMLASMNLDLIVSNERA